MVATAGVALCLTDAAAGPVPTQGLVAHWDFEGTADNAQGDDLLNGNLTGGAALTNTDPVSGSYLDLDGVAGFVEIPIQVLTDFDSSWSVATWFRTDTAPDESGTEHWSVFETVGNATISIGLGSDSPDRISIICSTKNGTDPAEVISTELQETEVLDQWTHVALVYQKDGEARSLRAFVNGVEVGELPLSAPLQPAAAGLHIGGPGGATGDFFPGDIDEVAIWSRALDAGELLALNSPELDVNGDSSIGATDAFLVELARSYDPGNLEFDVNGDAVVDAGDVLAIEQSLPAIDENLVTTSDDTGSGSLREILSQAATNSGAGCRISFASDIAGGSIILDSELVIPAGTEVIIDGGEAGITIDAGQGSRALDLQPGATAALHRLAITGGSAGDDGGAIRIAAAANLSLSASTLTANFSAPGSVGGGAISNLGKLVLDHCTLAKNHAHGSGGAIYQAAPGSTRIRHCTIAGNSAGTRGGGVSVGGGTLSISNTIVSDNYSPVDPDLSGTVVQLDTNVVTVDPKLAPLGGYGSPLQIMPALAASPAIDAATGMSVRLIDQRGFDSNGAPDIGAIETGPVTLVTNAADSGVGTLREAITDAAQIPGAHIQFDGALSGQTIILDSTPLSIPGTADNLIIDASALDPGLSIDADGSADSPRRVMTIAPGGKLSLHHLSLTGGHCAGNFPQDAGGAIFSRNATVTLQSCTIWGNRANYGGGLYSDGSDSGGASLSLHSCTVADNAASVGGAVFTDASSLGESTLTLIQCTIASNTADLGGGIYADGSGSVSGALTAIENSIIGRNIQDLREFGNTITRLLGTNVISNTLGSAIDPEHPAMILATPNLAPLSDYGGNTPTMIPLPGSPAIDSATAPFRGRDQRGLGNVSAPDIGAAEFQDPDDFEFALPIVWDFDHDFDGNTFGVEFALGTLPFTPDPSHPANLAFALDSSTNPVITFKFDEAVTGAVIWIVEKSTDLSNWTEVYRSADPANGESTALSVQLSGEEVRLTDPTSASGAEVFYRFRAELFGFGAN